MKRFILSVFTVFCFGLFIFLSPTIAQDGDTDRPEMPSLSDAEKDTAKSIIAILGLAKKNNDAKAYLKAAKAAAKLKGTFAVGDELTEELSAQDMLDRAKAIAPDDADVQAEAKAILDTLIAEEDQEFSGEKKFKVCSWKMKWGFDKRGRFKGKHTWSCLGKTLRRF